MERVITYDLGENFINNLAGFILSHSGGNHKDLSKIACIFGGKRPALFLNRALAQRIKTSFYPPTLFSIDRFTEYPLSPEECLTKISRLDAAYLIYTISRELAPDIIRNKSFGEFLPWAREIVSFIERLDLEVIDNSALKNIQMSACIGYDIPQSINVLLQHIIAIRRQYHSVLREKKIYSRGLVYLEACRKVKDADLTGFDKIIFANFFYLHNTETHILKEIYQTGKGIFIFQGRKDQWSVLKDNAQKLGISLFNKKVPRHEPILSLHAGYDLQTQVAVVREIVQGIKQKENTVIVLPRPETLIPLLSQISSLVNNFNVSLGYPLKRNSFFVLFNLLFKAQNTKKKGLYYTPDYLNLLRHPLVKNLKFSNEPAMSRVLVHKIEEVLGGEPKTEVGGSIFIDLGDLENLEELYTLSRDTLRSMDVTANIDILKGILREIHQFLFRNWENIAGFKDFSIALGKLNHMLIHKSILTNFPFNVKVMERISALPDELANLSFSHQHLEKEQMFSIFLQKLKEEVVSFIGSPLRGLQILGLFETRSLNFDNVIVLDLNESILPKLKIYEPLIPREVMLSLGLNRLEKEEEIQRYQFMRLIAGAKKVYLIYEENQAKEKSRFIEELLWQKQKKLGKLEVLNVSRGTFSLKTKIKPLHIKKTKEIIDFLKQETYSATRINTYLKCPLQFYYKYALGLKDTQDMLDEPGAKDIGNFFHELLEETWRKFINKTPLINKNFKLMFMRVFEDKFSHSLARRMKADSFLLKGIIKNRLKKFLAEEKKRDVLRVICVEEKFKSVINIDGLSLNFIAKVDRIDELRNGNLVILDYKTGNVNLTPVNSGKLQEMDFSRESIKEKIKSFQLPLYYHIVQQYFPNKELSAQLYSLRTLARKQFIADTDKSHKADIISVCMEALRIILKELFDFNLDFAPDEDERHCQFCSFSALCH